MGERHVYVFKTHSAGRYVKFTLTLQILKSAVSCKLCQESTVSNESVSGMKSITFLLEEFLDKHY